MVVFGRREESKSLMWKKTNSSLGSAVHISEEQALVVGNHKCQETDVFEVDNSRIAVFAGGNRSNITQIDIDTVKKGDTPLAFSFKCLFNSKAFTYSKPLDFKEGTMLLREARITGKYDTAMALEGAGIMLKGEF